MVTMTLLPRSRPLTRADLEAMPDDGHRYEIVDGTLLVTPAPSLRHQLVSSRLHACLTNAAPAGLLVLSAPTDIVLAEDTVVQPDLLVVRRTDIDDARAILPLLAVEILSPSTRRIDLALKKSRYEAAAITSYWVVDPETPEIVAWELRQRAYAEVGRAEGGTPMAVTEPFSVEIVPERLLD